MSAVHAVQARACPARATPSPPRPARRVHAGPVVAPVSSLSAIPAAPSVQPKCTECEAENKLPVQPRLEVGPANDHYEREADTIAGQVMAMRDADVSAAAPAVQRACAGCETEQTVRRQMDATEADEEEPKPRRQMDATEADEEEPKPRRQMDATEADEEEPKPRRQMDATEVDEEEPKPRRQMDATEADEEEPKPRRQLDASEEEGRVVQARRAPAGDESLGASAAELTGGGMPLPEATRGFYEARMGRDLSNVRVHKGDEAKSLNGSISARAFTYRDHIWLGSKESDAPSFTMAHELAHVMQQTSPGPVGPNAGVMAKRNTEVSGSGAKVQRVECKASDTLFFFPKGKTDITPYHDETTKWATKEDTELRGEVRVPNANRRGFTSIPSGIGSFGFADLVKTSNGNLVGMGFEMAAKAGSGSGSSTPGTGTPVARPWYTFNSKAGGGLMQPVSLTTFKPFFRDGKKFSARTTTTQMGKKSAPRWNSKTNDFVRDAATAPTSVKVGEVKFGGGRSLATAAATQLDRYATGFKQANLGYEQIRVQNTGAWAGTSSFTDKSRTKNLSTWTLSTGRLNGWNGPAGWQSISGSRKLVVSRWISEKRCAPCDGFDAVDGHLFASHDPDNSFLWLYTFEPSKSGTQFDAAGKAALKNDAATAKNLKADVVASPARKSKASRRLLPGQPRRPRSLAVTPDKRSRTLAARKKKKPVPKEDFFTKNYSKWKTKQSKLTTDFKATQKKKAGKKAINAILFDTAINNTVNITGKDPSGSTARKLSERALKINKALLNDIILMSGNSGRFIGALRKTFGGAFIKIINIYTAMRQKFSDFMKKKKSFSKKSRLAKAAMKVGGKIFAAIIHQVLPEVAHLLMECVKQGFKGAFDKVFGKDLDALIGEKIEEVEAKFAEITKQVETKIDALVGSIVGGLTKRYEDILKEWEKLETLIKIAKTAFNAVRALVCVAGGLETLGVSCVVAGVDWVLSLFDASPSELLAESLLETCTAQELIGEYILGLNVIKTLPTKIAQEVLAFVRPKLPSTDVAGIKIDVASLLCKTIGGAGDIPSVDEVTCGKGGSLAGAPEGAKWKPPATVNVTILNRKPTAKEIKDHGRLPMPVAPGGSATKPKEAADSIREGKVANGKAGKINLAIHGGFNPSHKYDGKKAYPVKVIGTDNSGAVYGPLPVDIWVFNVDKVEKQWFITFTFRVKKAGANIVLIDAKTGSESEIIDSAKKRFRRPLRPEK